MYEISRYSLELGLLQIVTFPTRQCNILNIFITNRPSLLRSCTSIPGISDHEAVCVLSNIIAKVHNSIPRKIVLWNKANFTLIEEIIIDFNNKFQLSYDPSTPVSTLWDKFNDFANCLNENKQIDTIFLTSKAFDKVPHQRLFNKLSYYGIKGSTLAWIQNYLTNRYQRVTLERICSSNSPVTSGVPQGTVLAPLLFLCFVNDIPASVQRQIIC